jgi:hypothetical protein
MRYALAVLLVSGQTVFAQDRIQHPVPNAGTDTDAYWSPQNRVDPDARKSEAPRAKAFGATPAQPTREPQRPLLSDNLDLPISDVDRACGKLDYAQSRVECVKSEQRNYESLKYMWSRASEKVKRRSLEYAKPMLNSVAYYYTLESYISGFMRNEEIERENANPPHFRR